MIPLPSDEQINIIDKIQTNNVIVNAVAGSGKTTTNLHIANKYQHQKILLLTYNKDLKIDSRKKANIMKLNNLEVHSYHSFCVKYYYKKAFDDSGIINILEKQLMPLINLDYDIIIIDEIQDINILYYELICKIFCDIEKNPNLCILGDINQCINIWNHSDSRYIIFAEKLFNFNDNEWINCNLSTSYRLTDEMSLFINNCLYDNDNIITKKTFDKVRYIIDDCFAPYSVLNEVIYYLDKGYVYEDFFILAPSVKSSIKIKPVQILANALTELNIPIYVPNSDDKELDKTELEGKIVFSTFHQAKGRERKICIVYNFDDSYFKFFSKEKNPTKCPNELYVAVTRGSEYLSLIHHYQNDYLFFLKNKCIEKYVSLIKNQNILIKNNNNKLNFDTNVTDLTRHLPAKIINHCLTFFEIKKIQECEKKINIPIKIKQGKLTEGVSDITGIAIPSFFELQNTKTMTIFNKIKNLNKIKKKEYLFIDEDDEYNDKNKFNDINILNLKPNELLYISNEWNSFKSGYNFRLNQIQDYNWLSEENLKLCINRLENKISKNAEYEIKFTTENNEELLNRKLNGYFDCLDNNTLWEFKCVKQLKKEHFLQLAIYMYMHKDYLNKKQQNKNKLLNLNNDEILNFFFTNWTPSTQESNEEKIKYNYNLFNILTNEICSLESTNESLSSMIEYLINYKFYSKIIITDKEFVEKNIKIYEKYFILQ